MNNLVVTRSMQPSAMPPKAPEFSAKCLLMPAKGTSTDASGTCRAQVHSTRDIETVHNASGETNTDPKPPPHAPLRLHPHRTPRNWGLKTYRPPRPGAPSRLEVTTVRYHREHSTSTRIHPRAFGASQQDADSASFKLQAGMGGGFFGLFVMLPPHLLRPQRQARREMPARYREVHQHAEPQPRHRRPPNTPRHPRSQSPALGGDIRRTPGSGSGNTSTSPATSPVDSFTDGNACDGAHLEGAAGCSRRRGLMVRAGEGAPQALAALRALQEVQRKQEQQEVHDTYAAQSNSPYFQRHTLPPHLRVSSPVPLPIITLPDMDDDGFLRVPVYGVGVGGGSGGGGGVPHADRVPMHFPIHVVVDTAPDPDDDGGFPPVPVHGGGAGVTHPTGQSIDTPSPTPFQSALSSPASSYRTANISAPATGTTVPESIAATANQAKTPQQQSYLPDVLYFVPVKRGFREDYRGRHTDNRCASTLSAPAGFQSPATTRNPSPERTDPNATATAKEHHHNSGTRMRPAIASPRRATLSHYGYTNILTGGFRAQSMISTADTASVYSQESYNCKNDVDGINTIIESHRAPRSGTSYDLHEVMEHDEFV
ncbi:hypothetical protein BDZ91DRAFT_807625 [Kalaharituber pfeilii]|nr:hypothetical protein BDZ91DRAFT_807625 [Kalaharituber pfeilii]